LNNNSVVMRVRYGAATVLLGGELQEEGQQRLLDARADVRAAVFKVPHHGSVRFLRSFYEATHATVALIPVGPNDYGQPSVASLEALAALGIRAYRTDRLGDVAIVLDEKGGMTVRTG
jgi:competence protein ComEC